MADNNFNKTIESLFKGMDGFISSKTIVGEPIQVNDTTLVPLMDVSFGMAAGAWHRDHKESASGGMGGKLSPSAILVIKDGMVRVVTIGATDPVSKIMDIAPDLISKFTNRSKDDPQVEQTIDQMKEDAKNE